MSAKPKTQLAQATANPLAPNLRMLIDEVAPIDILRVFLEEQSTKQVLYLARWNSTPLRGSVTRSANLMSLERLCEELAISDQAQRGGIVHGWHVHHFNVMQACAVSVRNFRPLTNVFGSWSVALNGLDDSIIVAARFGKAWLARRYHEKDLVVALVDSCTES